jgi:hypothetical protein
MPPGGPGEVVPALQNWRCAAGELTFEEAFEEPGIRRCTCPFMCRIGIVPRLYLQSCHEGSTLKWKRS